MRPEDVGIGRLFQGVRDAVILADAETQQIRLWNAAATDMFGYSTSEALGLRIEALIPERLKARHREGIARYAATGHGTYVDSRSLLELPALTKSGEEISIELSLSPIQNIPSVDERRFVLAIIRDVTDRKKAEEEIRRLNEGLENRILERTSQLETALAQRKRVESKLREAEARARMVIERIPAVTYIQTLEDPSITTYVSPQMKSLLGYEPEECTSDPDHWTKILYPDDKERVLAKDRRTNETGEPFKLEYRQFAKDGSVVWVRDEAALVPDGEGNPSYWIGVQIDITERKKTEEKLRYSEERFRSLVQNVSDVIMILEADGAIRYVSPAIEKMMGYHPEERVGTNSFDVVHPDDLERASSIFTEVLQTPGERPPIEFRMLHKDGSWRVLEHNVNNLLHEPTVMGIVVTTRDITERKRTEDALREARDRFRSVFDHAPIGMARVSVEGRYLQVNRSLCEILGHPEDELLASSWQEITHPDDLAVSAAHARRILEGEISRYDLEKRFLHADGHAVWTSLSVSLVRGSEGEPLYFVNKIQDVTERKKAEERYRTLVETVPAVTYTDRAVGSYPDMAIYTSPQIEAMLGYSVEEWCAPEINLWEERLHPEDRAWVLAADEQSKATGEPFGQEYRLIAKDGSVVWVRDQAALLRDASGEPWLWQGVLLDVTDRKEAERKLREAEQRYRSLVERVPAVVYIQEIGSPQSAMYMSPRIETLTGYTPEDCKDPDLRWGMVHPEDRERMQSEDERAGESGGVFGTEYRVVHRDGRTKWVRNEAVIIEDEASGTRYWQGFMLDITEYKQAEEALRRSEARYRAVIEQTLEGIYLGAADTKRVLESNAAFQGMLGYTAEELRGMHVHDFLAHDRENIDSVFQSVLDKGHRSIGERKYRRKDGSTVAVETSATVISYDNREVLCTVVRDVTKRKEAEEALVKSEERFRALTQNSSDIITLLGADGTVRYQSPSAGRILGYRPEEMIGDNAFRYVHPDDLGQVEMAFAEALKNSSRRPSAEYRFRHKDGWWVWLESVGTNLLDEPRVGEYVVNSRDVTERRKAEEELREANRRLRELAVLKADFTAMIAHELDTPLAVIRGYAEMLATGELEPAEQSRALDKIQAETQILNALVGDVRVAATVEREDFTVQPQPVPIRALLDNAVQCGAPLLGNHPLVTEYTADDEQVWADQNRVGQVVRNLVSNAARYSPDSAPIELRAKPGRTPGRVRIEVADRGPGIHPDDVRRVFEKFGRGRDRHGRKVAGTGLGLYLSRRIVQAHGSDLTLNRGHEDGSVFGFELEAVR